MELMCTVVKTVRPDGGSFLYLGFGREIHADEDEDGNPAVLFALTYRCLFVDLRRLSSDNILIFYGTLTRGNIESSVDYGRIYGADTVKTCPG